MKKLFFAALFTLSLSAFAFGQEKSQHIPKWISTEGYWQVVSNIKAPKENVVYFFNNENVLIYKENISGMKLKLNKRKTLLRLKTALDEALQAWTNNKMFKDNDVLIATAFKR